MPSAAQLGYLSACAYVSYSSAPSSTSAGRGGRGTRAAGAFVLGIAHPSSSTVM